MSNLKGEGDVHGAPSELVIIMVDLMYSFEKKGKDFDNVGSSSIDVSSHILRNEMALKEEKDVRSTGTMAYHNVMSRMEEDLDATVISSFSSLPVLFVGNWCNIFVPHGTFPTKSLVLFRSPRFKPSSRSTSLILHIFLFE